MRWEVEVLRCYFLLTTQGTDLPGGQQEGRENPPLGIRRLW